LTNLAKRFLDVVASAASLVLLSPVFIVTAALVRLGSSGPVLFRQQRIGRGFRPFLIYKFRTMYQDARATGPAITIGCDPRITPWGRFLRKTKIDELPQLFNVLKGDMSLVGPRPEVPQYVEMYRTDFAEILQVRPGITDLASLKFRHESELLAQADDPEREYCEAILPSKIALAKEYIRRSSVLFDVVIILKTVGTMFQTKAPDRAEFPTNSRHRTAG
jgi:lipopolysaccharide/colanic/teichoic acid biosynthesis glycosyltransferase